MNTDVLRAFVTVAETGGFTAAARLLHRTQSAISLQIKRLEGQPGSELLERTNRNVSLTDAGRRSLPYARHILQLEDSATHALGTAKNGELIRFGLSEERASAYLPRILQSYSASGIKPGRLYFSGAWLVRA